MTAGAGRRLTVRSLPFWFLGMFGQRQASRDPVHAMRKFIEKGQENKIEIDCQVVLARLGQILAAI